MVYFDANKERPFSFDPIPEGIYRVEITSAEEKANKKMDGKVLEIGFVVVDGEMCGAALTGWLNIENPSQKSQQIGRGQLSTICRVVKQMVLNDPCELVGHRLCIRVVQVMRPGKNFGDPPQPTNEVKGFYPADYQASQVQADEPSPF